MAQSTTNRTERTVDTDTALSLLSDEYSREILDVLTDGPATANELVEHCRASRVTVYRRLNSLEDAGFVQSRTKLRCDGNHCAVYRRTVETVRISLTDDGLEVEFGS